MRPRIYVVLPGAGAVSGIDEVRFVNLVLRILVKRKKRLVRKSVEKESISKREMREDEKVLKDKTLERQEKNAFPNNSRYKRSQRKLKINITLLHFTSLIYCLAVRACSLCY